MTTDDFTDDVAEVAANLTVNGLLTYLLTDRPVLVKVIVGDEPEPGIELEISTDPYDLETL